MTSPCSVAGCAAPVRARGWCNTHYRRWQRHGDPCAHIPIRSGINAGEIAGVDAQRVLSLYRHGVSARAIARHLGIGRTAINRLLHHHSIPIRRPPQPASPNEPTRPDHHDTNPNDSDSWTTDRSPTRTQQLPTTPRHPDPQGAASAAGRTEPPC